MLVLIVKQILDFLTANHSSVPAEVGLIMVSVKEVNEVKKNIDHELEILMSMNLSFKTSEESSRDFNSYAGLEGDSSR